MLNSWSDDWTTTASEPSTDQMPTIETIRRAMREFQEKWKDKDLGPDVWVLTDDKYRQLELLCEKRRPNVTWNDLPKDPWTIYGIRVEHLPTREQVRARVLELADKGVKAGFLADEVQT